MTHEIIAINPYVSHDVKNGYFLKDNGRMGGFDITGVQDDYQTYQELSKWFVVPRARLLNHRDNPILVMQRAKGEEMKNLLQKGEYDTCAGAMALYVDDCLTSWQETSRPTEEELLKRNMRVATLKAIGNVKGKDFFEEIKDKKMIVNGKKFPSLDDTLSEIEGTLMARIDPVMVFCHGDEHFENILAHRDGYSLIDPRSGGYATPAQVVNSLVGTSYITYWGYDQEVIQSDSKVGVDYKLTESSQKSKEATWSHIRRLEDGLGALSPHAFSTREYVYVNLLRAACGMVHPKSQKQSHENRYVLAGLASEIYYEGL